MGGSSSALERPQAHGSVIGSHGDREAGQPAGAGHKGRGTRSGSEGAHRVFTVLLSSRRVVVLTIGNGFLKQGASILPPFY